MKTLQVPVFMMLFIATIAFVGAFSPVVHAESPIQPASCHVFGSNIRAGQQDSVSSVEVNALQTFLVDQGYFDAANLGTGHFGPLTLIAVKKFQAAHAVPATGFVGPLTRAAIAKVQTDCGNNTQAATLYSVSPEKGPISTEISIRGFGFSAANTILADGFVIARDVPIKSSVAIACTTDPSCHRGINQTIVFTLPSYASPDCPVGSMCPMFVRELTPGTMTMTVRNDSKISNSLPFTITK